MTDRCSLAEYRRLLAELTAFDSKDTYTKSLAIARCGRNLGREALRVLADIQTRFNSSDPRRNDAFRAGVDAFKPPSMSIVDFVVREVERTIQEMERRWGL